MRTGQSTPHPAQTKERHMPTGTTPPTAASPDGWRFETNAKLNLNGALDNEILLRGD